MNWAAVTLGEVMTIGRGSSPRPIRDERFFVGGKIPWVKIADATASGKYIYETKQCVNDFGASFSRKLSPGALIFPASGTLGIPRFLGVEACIHDGWLYFTDYEGVDADWLYYRLILLKSYYEGIAYGAAIQNINTEIVRNTKIQLPDIKTQNIISSVLCAYDELIEVNLQRISLLEESAHLLYREWFINLRFPGFELVKRTEGVPEGWSRERLDSALLLQRGFDLPNGVRKPGNIPIYASAGINGYHSEAKVKGPGIVTGRSGTLGLVHYVPGDFWPLNTALWVKEFRRVTPLFAYFMLSDMNLAQYNSGASVPSLDRKVVHPVEILIPPEIVIGQFGEYVEPLFEQVEYLREANLRAAEARDALLPKLMSGAIQV